MIKYMLNKSAKKDEGLPYQVVGGVCILTLVFSIVYLKYGEDIAAGTGDEVIKPFLVVLSVMCLLVLLYCGVAMLFFSNRYCIYENIKGGRNLIKYIYAGECLENPDPERYEDGRSPKIRENFSYLISGIVYLILGVAISYVWYWISRTSAGEKTQQ